MPASSSETCWRLWIRWIRWIIISRNDGTYCAATYQQVTWNLEFSPSYLGGTLKKLYLGWSYVMWRKFHECRLSDHQVSEKGVWVKKVRNMRGLKKLSLEVAPTTLGQWYRQTTKQCVGVLNCVSVVCPFGAALWRFKTHVTLHRNVYP